MKQRENRSLLKNYKLVMAFILGLIVASGGVYAATTIAGSNITYSNTKSGLNSTDVQGAIDELYEKANITGKFLEAYTYSETGANKCISGEETTCKETTCYKTKIANSCPKGTIIKYKVNNSESEIFHVMFDKGSKLIMQSQRNIINDNWYNGDDNTKGPLTILSALENATKEWNNVNNQTYTMGTTVFTDNAYTGCESDLNCKTNAYTLPERTAKSRMITVQEAKALGCTSSNDSCPIWMYNYLLGSIQDGPTGYWTMSANSKNENYAFFISNNGKLENYYIYISNVGVRPIVEVSK